MPKLLGEVTAILMAKRPTAGQVKTRLVKEGCLSADEASQLAWEMLLCTAKRLTVISKTVLAVSPDGDAQQLASDLGVQFDKVVGQGEGNLGQRLDRVWNIIGTDKLIAFFGGDVPDVPLSHLAEIPGALNNNDIAIGPTDDGGYWTLAARSYFPAVLEEIDWGSDMVYDQTCNRAAQAGLSITHLKLWYDVDRQEDLVALRTRLQQILSSSLENEEDYEALRSLAQRVEKLPLSWASTKS